MIDAYTIGVTLALDDGVSAGLLQIRAELSDVLAATERATAALAALRAMAGEVTRIAPPPVPPPPRAREPDAAPVEPIAAPVPRAPEGGATEIAVTRLTERVAPSAPGAPGRTATEAPPAPAAPLLPAIPAPRAEEIAVAPVEAGQPAPIPAVTLPRAEPVRAAPLPLAQAVPARKRIAPDAELAAVRIDAAIVPPADGRRPGPQDEGRDARAVADRVSPGRSSFAGRSSARSRRAAIAPGGGTPDARTAIAPAERAPAARAREADGGSRDAAPREGTIHLDGAVLGTWIETYLTRRIGGPRGAGTGFDARMTPAWPGMAME